ncbi:S9 family peptidase [Gracilimonas mengyeensis]|uniref:Dipeptidyl aminopeptidase/acylaminoacyl peptidase n=1 Tax=Gracilimonas mengyeensis TaxID=1302730 RepID=A0A521AD42_9BACT|nr:DPP IV N-terminal domain-containing protein [Gracilimonas mengyeensis]SMO32686.1 Dipeptidyl aminopeptidase/acylaminoacyl peptidase [Gracilimonas mengyeensis]
MFTTLPSSKKYSLLILLGIIITTNTYAQKANFEAAERFKGERMEKLIGDTEVDPNWIEDTDTFWYSFKNEEGRNWYFVDVSRPSQRLLFDRDELASQLAEIFSKPFNAKELELNDFDYNTDKERFTFNVDSIEFTYNLNGKELIKGDSLQEEKEDDWKTFSPDSTWIAFARDHNLYVMRADDPDSTEIQLTEDGERWFSYQDEDGDTTSNKRLEANVNWFEDSEKFWVKRQDKRKVDELWVINSLGDRPELETYKYPMPGEDHVFIDEIKVFDPEAQSSVTLDTDKWEDQSLGGAYFNEGGIFETDKSDYLYILRRNRGWNKIDVLKADTETGNTEVLFSEESNPYFNTRFAQLAIINEGEEYIWWSERTGWGQLYRYNSDGQLKNTITSGNYVVGDIAKIDTARQTIYFSAYGREEGQNPYFENLYSVKFDGSRFRHLSPEDANHEITASEKGNYFLDNFSKVDEPTTSVIRDASGEITLQLQQVNMQAAEEIGWEAPEEFQIKAADGVTDLYGVMWKPFDFDSTRSYPIISYVYPGPQVEPFPTTFELDRYTGRNQALAQLGFVVVAFGNRGGSPLRSKYYHNYGYGNLRDYPLADNKYGIEQLAARHSFIDQERVGIFGHSGGGFMSTAALLTYPDFYDVAVSSAGNHDNNIYNIWWSEVHNGVQEKRETVTEMNEDSVEVEKEVITHEAGVDSNTDLAGNLKGHLLLVHGNVDNNVHPANTIRLADELIKAGKRFDMMILPGRRHGFGPYQPYFERMKWYYFAEHLLDDYRDNVEFNLPEEEE